MRRRSIAIVGAGLAGLTAAWRLRERGFDPVVFEAEREPGGRARSINEGGLVQDLGAWTFTGNGPVIRLAREIGLSKEWVIIPATVGRPDNGRLRVADLARPVTFLRGPFNPAEVFSLARIFLQARTSPADTSDESAAAWAVRRFSEAFTRDILEPLAALYYLQDLNTLSRNALLGTIGYLTGIELYGFRAGMGRLTSVLASKVAVRSGAGVDRIHLTKGGIRIIGRGFTETADGLIVATPLPETIRLLKSHLSPETVRTASEWRYAPSLAVRLLLKGRWPKIALQVLPPRGRGRLACGLTVERAKHDTRVPDGYELVTMFARPDRVQALDGMADEALAEAFDTELGCWLGGRKGRLEKFHVQRWRHAAAFTDPDAGKRLPEIDRGFEALARKAPVWAAGDFRGISGLSGAIQSAERAAHACSIHFSAPGDPAALACET